MNFLEDFGVISKNKVSIAPQVSKADIQVKTNEPSEPDDKLVPLRRANTAGHIQNRFSLCASKIFIETFKVGAQIDENSLDNETPTPMEDSHSKSEESPCYRNSVDIDSEFIQSENKLKRYATFNTFSPGKKEFLEFKAEIDVAEENRKDTRKILVKGNEIRYPFSDSETEDMQIQTNEQWTAQMIQKYSVEKSEYLCMKLLKESESANSNKSKSWKSYLVEIRGPILLIYQSYRFITRKNGNKPSSMISITQKINKYIKARKSPKYAVILSGCTAQPFFEQENKLGLFTFKLITSKKYEILFGCETLESMSQWIKLIKLKTSITEIDSSVTTLQLRNDPIIAAYTSSLDLYHQKTGRYYPIFLKRIIIEIESERNKKKPSLYRINGNLAKIDQLKAEIDANEKIVHFNDPKSYGYDVQVLCGLLKSYLHEMKDPIIKNENYSDIIDWYNLPLNEEDKLNEMKKIINKLPTCNYETLKIILVHLKVVSGYTSKADEVSNIPIILGPCIIRRSSRLFQDFLQIPIVSVILQYLINNVVTLFE